MSISEAIVNSAAAFLASYPHAPAAAASIALALAFIGAFIIYRLRRRNRRALPRQDAVDHKNDRPILAESSDSLDRAPFVETLVKVLVRIERDRSGNAASARSTGFIVGLTGPWGIGKSSTLNLLQRRLEKVPGVAVAYINPWLFKDRDELLNAYFNILRKSLGSNSNEKIRSLLFYLERYQKAIDWVGKTSSKGIDAYFSSGAATKLWSYVSVVLPFLKSKPPLSPEQERKELEKKLLASNVAVVVLIDELDRIEDSEVRAIAQMIKAVGDISGISYLIAYDPARVIDALGRGDSPDARRAVGERYLEKIIQFPIPLRPLFEEDVVTMITSLLATFDVNLQPPDNDNQKSIQYFLQKHIKTPREVKRLVSAFSVLESVTRGEICPYDVLGYCWILIRSPQLYDEIVTLREFIIDDPGIEELASRAAAFSDSKYSAPSVTSVLGKSADPYEQLLKIMFPRFGTGKDGEGDRISRRHNLVRILYFGNPPGMFGWRDVERLWNINNTSYLEKELRSIYTSGHLPDFVDRLGDILPKLPATGGEAFWISASRIFVRQTDWIHGADGLARLAGDVATVLTRMGLRSPANARRVKRTVENLIEAGDLTIAPWILRKHLFAHGLTKHGRTERGPVIFDVEETEALLRREIPRYREAVKSGFALRRLSNTEVFFVLLNTQQWDAELRENLTQEMNSREAVQTLAALFVPPGVTLGKDTLEEMCDLAPIYKFVQQTTKEDGAPGDAWAELSVRRLRTLLEGGDPLFLDPVDELE